MSRSPFQTGNTSTLPKKWRFLCDIRSPPNHYNDFAALGESGRALMYKHVELLDHFDASREMPVLAAASLARTPVIVHLNYHTNKQSSPSTAAKYLAFVSDHFPELRIIVAHLGGEHLLVAEEEAHINPRIFFEMSCIRQTSDRLGMASASEVLRRVVSSVGSRRVLFGSDMTGFGDRTLSLEFDTVTRTLNSRDCLRVLSSNGLETFRKAEQHSPAP